MSPAVSRVNGRGDQFESLGGHRICHFIAATVRRVGFEPLSPLVGGGGGGLFPIFLRLVCLGT